jgi:hypothetical protein
LPHKAGRWHVSGRSGRLQATDRPACAWLVTRPRQRTNASQNVSGAPRQVCGGLSRPYPPGRQHPHSQPTSAAKATISTISISNGTVGHGSGGVQLSVRIEFPCPTTSVRQGFRARTLYLPARDPVAARSRRRVPRRRLIMRHNDRGGYMPRRRGDSARRVQGPDKARLKCGPRPRHSRGVHYSAKSRKSPPCGHRESAGGTSVFKTQAGRLSASRLPRQRRRSAPPTYRAAWCLSLLS